MNGDYIPLDQTVIDQEVERMAQSRRSARALLAEALKDAGGNTDIVVIHNKDFDEFKRRIKALEALRIFWCDIDRDLYVNRHELDEVINNRLGN